MNIQVPDDSRAEQRSFGNQMCSGLPTFEKEQTILQCAQSTPTEGRRYQVCDLCKVEPGNKVTISQEWQTALWVAEKQVVTRIQPLVQSPILTRYAGAAYSLRQKPWGWCCKACETWVFEQEQCIVLQSGFSVVAQVWPQLGDAALTGPRFFPVDFAPWEEGEPGVIQEGNIAKVEETVCNASNSVPGVQTRSRVFKAPKQTRKTWCQSPSKTGQTLEQTGWAGSGLKGNRSQKRPEGPKQGGQL